MRARRLALGGLWLAAAIGCAGASIPRARLADWHAVEAGSFRLVGDAPPQEIERLAGQLARFDAAFARLTQRPAPAEVDPVSIYLISDPELARRFWLGGGVAGWTLPTLEGCFAAVGVHANHDQTRRTLQHEYTHVLLRRNRRGPLPPWYDEGLASYFSTLSTRDGAVVVGAASAGTLTWIAERGTFPLERLFDAAVWQLRREEIADFYATSWLLAHYLLGSPGGRRELSRFAAELERGVAWREAQSAAFGRPTAALQAEVEAHAALLARGVPAEAVLEPTGVRAVPPAAPVPRAEVAYELGYLALRLADADTDYDDRLARGLLELAVAEDAASARAEAALAETEAVAGSPEEASVRAQRAAARAPADARVLVHAGRVELARAEAGEPEGDAEALRAAEAAYRSALAVEAESAVAWTGLGRTWRRAGRSDEAVDAFERARRLAWSPRLDLELGSLYLERGQREQAVALLWPLAQDPHRGEETEEATELLERAGLAPTAAGRQER